MTPGTSNFSGMWCIAGQVESTSAIFSTFERSKVTLDVPSSWMCSCQTIQTINWNAVWPVGQYQNFNKQLCVKYCWQCFLFCGHPIDQSCTWSTSCMTCASNSSPSSMALRNSKNKHVSTCIGNWCSRSIVNTEHAIHHPSTKSQSSPMIQAGFQCL